MSVASTRDGKLPRGARRRLRNHEAMLDAAENLFATRPFNAVRIEDVADAADVSVGSVYTHFQSKDNLLVAVAERRVRPAIDGVVALMESEGRAVDRLIAVGRAYMALLLANPVYLRFLSSDVITGGGGKLDEYLASLFDDIRDMVVDLIDQAIEAGEIRVVDGRLGAYFLFASWKGVAELAFREGPVGLSPEDVQACLAQAEELLVLGLTSGIE